MLIKKKKTFLAKEYLKIISKKKLDLRPNYFLKKVEHKEDTLTQFKLILPRLLIKFFLGLKSFFFKKKEFKIQILKKRFKEASHLDILLHNYNKQLELKEYISLYKKYSIELSKIHKYNYIYFSLNRDVEKTVCPDGKVFKDVEFILDYAVTFLPKNYYLFIKDHPACFLIKNATNINRNTYFLKKIINKSNRIKIIDINENQSEIIKKSKGVISLTGTSCWEAILLGKPSAVFGTTWYEKCSLIYNISEKGQFIKFINRLKKKSKLNKKEIIKFLRFIYYNCFPSKFLNLDDKKNKEKNINFLTNEIKKKKF